MPFVPEPWLTTDRLELRRFVPADYDFLLALHTDPQVADQIGGVRTPDEVQKLLDHRILAYYEEHPGLGAWCTSLRGSKERIGLHLVNHIQGESLVQVGYVLARPFWGRGYATEMARALLDYAYRTLALPEINAITNLTNTASQRVLLKCGLERRGERSFAHPAYASAGPLAWFASDRESWLRLRGGKSGT